MSWKRRNSLKHGGQRWRIHTPAWRCVCVCVWARCKACPCVCVCFILVVCRIHREECWHSSPVWRGGQEVVAYIHSWPHAFSLPACVSGSHIWPCAVIGHTEPRSLCFRPAEACGRHAQAVGLVNLRDSSVRPPKVPAPLLYNDFTPTQHSHRTTPRTGSERLHYTTFMWYVYHS